MHLSPNNQAAAQDYTLVTQVSQYEGGGTVFSSVEKVQGETDKEYYARKV